jgi:hypothetical protein
VSATIAIPTPTPTAIPTPTPTPTARRHAGCVPKRYMNAMKTRAGLLVALVLVLVGHGGCSSSSSSASSCAADSQCPSGQRCLFAVGSCLAEGQCLNPATLGPMCNIVVTYCGCNGSTVGGLCGPAYAFGPTEGKPGPCGTQ